MLLKTHPSALRLLAVIGFTTVLAACSEPQQTTSPSQEKASAKSPQFSLSSGFGGALLGRSSIPEGFKLKRKNGPWEIDIHAKDPVDIAVQSLTIQPGGHSGWHSHPGPVFLQILTGTMTFYEADDPSCAPLVRTAGQVFVEAGDHSHIGRNEGTVTATALATVFSPPGAPLRIEETDTGNCHF
jgi:quercetin dioxygenase-like cupin family protein